MICNQCESSNLDYATFCGKCGGQFAQPLHIPPTSSQQPGISAMSKSILVRMLIGLNYNMSDGQFFQLFNIAPTAIIQSNGHFQFDPLPQGSYGLAWGTTHSDGSKHFQFAYNVDGSSTYVARVGP